jgi:tetratricopeptide (TPR) repeat protein
MPVPIIKQAAGLVQKRKFSQAISLLESKIFHYRNSFQYYYLLGLSCLYAGDLSGASSYLNRAGQLNANDINCQLGIAAVHLMRSEVDESLKIWLDIVNRDKKNKTAKNALALLRKGLQAVEISENPKKLQTILPPISRRISIIPILLLPLIAALIWAAYSYGPKLFESGKKTRIQEAGFEFDEKTASLISREGSYLYELSGKEIKSSLDKAKQYFNLYRDNMTLVETNRLLLSNASEDVKYLASFLKDNVKTPNFTNLKDNFGILEVRKDLPLYQDCYVIWKGKITNVSITEESINFLFLVGYHDEKELEGTVPVSLDFAVNIQDGDNLELLAQIDTSGNRLSLKGASIHKIQ